MQYSADIKKISRHFIPKNFILTNWENLEPYFKNLLERSIDTKEQMEQWLKDQSELEAVVNEDACWRQIRMTCDTENKPLKKRLIFYLWKFSQRFNPAPMH